MKKLLVLSGKGGTGKTTVTSTFIDFGQIKAYCDCDVDAPNLHLTKNFNEPSMDSPFVGSSKCQVDSSKCMGCGICINNCKFDALLLENNKAITNEFSCEGCGVCVISCPNEAIKLVPDIAGDKYLYKNHQVTFATAKLKMGRGNSGKLVSEVKNLLNDNISNEELAIIDGSPGIGCPVISSMSAVDAILIVAEPSLSGLSDMKRIISTGRFFQITPYVCINKYDTCIEKANEIKEYCKSNHLTFLGEIPYDSKIPEAINNAIPIASLDCEAKKSMQEIYNKLIKLMFNN
ncbi:MAG: ATP-binding protein [Anaerovoracaceae bacterium]